MGAEAERDNVPRVGFLQCSKHLVELGDLIIDHGACVEFG